VAPERIIEAGRLTVRSVREDNEQYISLSGEFDLTSGDALERELRRAEATDVTRILLDLGGLAFIDASAIHRLLALSAQASRTDDRLMLLRAREPVARILRLTGADRRLPFVA
jgi:anti-sigma B factor antagonist